MRRFAFLILLLLPPILAAQTFQDSLTVAYAPSPPFIIEGEDGEISGISVWAWRQIADEHGIAYRLQKMDLESMIAGLREGRVDMSMNPLTVTKARSEDIDFSFPFYVSNSTVAIGEVSSLEKGLQFLSSFFSLNFFRSILALFVVILIFGLLAWMFERRENPDEFQEGWKGIWSGIWWSAVTMTTVGYGDKSPRSTGGRVIALIWMFTAIIIISGFTASIASSLTVNQLGWSKNSISDFKKENIGSVANSATSAWLSQNFYREKQDYSGIASALEALTVNEVSAVAYDEPILKYLVYNDAVFSGLEILPIRFNPQYYSFGFSRSVDVTLKTKISKQIIAISEQESWKRLLEEYDL